MNNVTLNYLIKNIDKSKTNESDIAWRDISTEFKIYDLNWSDDKRLKAYYLQKNYCTDTFIGTRLYFLDDEFVAMSTQIGRKYDEDFTFASHEAATKVKLYLLSLLDEEEYSYSVISAEELEEEQSTLFSVSFNSQICNSTAWYDGEQVKVIKSNYGWDDNYSVLIELSNGNQTTVHVRDLQFEFNLKKD